ncbi:hypothetical protein FS837_010732 [Tulasnella sp. UAMH 9824]|nr:hypothetical protein FS837_010732 [Tulasnella sp. UAMH 9824]
MQNDERNPADPIHVSETNHEDSPGRVQLSPNTIQRLEKLARWRINPASVKFPEGTLKFEGGYAEVSRALLLSSTDDPKDQDMESDVGTFMSSNGTSNADGKNERHELEGSDQEKRPKKEVAAEGEDQVSGDETSRRWKVRGDHALGASATNC